MSLWGPLLWLLSWCPIFKSGHCNSFEDWAPIDYIYGYCQMSHRNLTLWQGTRIVAPVMSVCLLTRTISTQCSVLWGPGFPLITCAIHAHWPGIPSLAWRAQPHSHGLLGTTALHQTDPQQPATPDAACCYVSVVFCQPRQLQSLAGHLTFEGFPLKINSMEN